MSLATNVSDLATAGDTNPDAFRVMMNDLSPTAAMGVLGIVVAQSTTQPHVESDPRRAVDATVSLTCGRADL